MNLSIGLTLAVAERPNLGRQLRNSWRSRHFNFRVCRCKVDRMNFIQSNPALYSAYYPPRSRLSWRVRIPVLLFLALLFIAPLVGAQERHSADKDCGPPNYCARTDRRTESYPKTLPALGTAGSTFADPTFGSRISRVTDGTTDPRSSGRSFHTPSSSEQNSWDSTGTHFYVMEAGGLYLLFDFDPSTMKAQLRSTPGPQWGSEPQFSFSLPNILYGVRAKERKIEQYDLAGGRMTTIAEPSTCVKLGASDHGASVGASADDHRFLTVFGPQQDKYFLVYIYDRAKGCRWLNTQTGEIGGEWGPKGSISSVRSFGIHDARISKSGEFVLISGNSEGPVFWQVDTLNVTICSQRPPASCGGHHVMGYSHLINPSRLSHPMDLRIRALAHVETSSPLIGQLDKADGWYDKHFSWNNANPEDTAPACFSTYRRDNPVVPGSPLTIKGPWENEVDCVETDGKGSKIWRFAHTYSTAQGGFWSTPRGNVSRDGRFYMFTSDWENQLGVSSEGPRQQKYRTDVFVVELR